MFWQEMDERILTGNKTYSVRLNELKDSDRSILFEWINHKELVEFNSHFKPVSWEDHCRWFDTILRKEDVKIFAIRSSQDDKLMGTCQLLNINKLANSAELQIRLGDLSELGKGIGSQAVSLLLKYGFEDLKLNRIYLHVFSDNLRAIKAYLKNGFSEEGHLRESAFVEDKFKDVKVMAILKGDYNK
jgi:RimJ/RimL family protein N-acetyltransferase